MRALRQILSTEATLAALLERLRNEQAVLQSLRRRLPPALAAQVRIGAADEPELVLLAGSGAAGALLRQRAPDLLDQLALAGWKFTGIRVRVQARATREVARKLDPKQLDATSAAALLAGADRIDDPELAAALRRLAGEAAVPPRDAQTTRTSRSKK